MYNNIIIYIIMLHNIRFSEHFLVRILCASQLLFLLFFLLPSIVGWQLGGPRLLLLFGRCEIGGR